MSEHTIAAPTSEAMQELAAAWPEWYTAAMYCCSQASCAAKTKPAQGFWADITEPIVSPYIHHCPRT